MNRIRIAQVCAVLALSGAVQLAGAQTPPPDANAPAAASPGAPAAMGGHRGWHGGPHDQMAVHAAIGTLRQIERLYVSTGRVNQLPALYQDVLAKTRNPMLRDYAYRKLARAQLRPADPDKAIATLRAGLDEDLSRLDAPGSQNGMRAQ